MRKNWFLMLLMCGLLLAGCGTAMNGAQSAAEMSPKLMTAKDGNFFVYAYQGRHYVVGSEESSQKFLKNRMIPLTKTLLGAGPKGETVVFEFDKHNKELADQLIYTYQSTPFIADSKGDEFTVFKYQGRLFVTGTKKMKDFFLKNHMIPLTKTLLGAGPSGETVVFEFDKHNPAMTDQLIKQFQG